MGKKAMINALTEAFNKSKNSCVKITLRNYIDTVETLRVSTKRRRVSILKHLTAGVNHN